MFTIVNFIKIGHIIQYEGMTVEVSKALSGYGDDWKPRGTTYKELARETGSSYYRVLYWFRKWCELNGYHPSEFHKIEVVQTPMGIVPRTRTIVPPEAAEWVRKKLKNPPRSGPTMKTWSSKKIVEKQLKRKIITTADLSKKYGIRMDRIRREFKWWCYYRNKKPGEFFHPGIGYILPEEFIAWFEETVVGREKR